MIKSLSCISKIICNLKKREMSMTADFLAIKILDKISNLIPKSCLSCLKIIAECCNRTKILVEY